MELLTKIVFVLGTAILCLRQIWISFDGDPYKKKRFSPLPFESTEPVDSNISTTKEEDFINSEEAEEIQKEGDLTSKEEHMEEKDPIQSIEVESFDEEWTYPAKRL